jgi:hypothetical protein
MNKTCSIVLRSGAVAAAALACTVSAFAQASPYYIGVNQRFTHQSNVFQTSASPVSDTVSSTSLVAGFDQPISRQRLFGSLTASANRYSDLSPLDHSAYSGRAGIDWATVGNLTGSLTADASQSLADFNPVGFTGTTLKSITKNQGIAAVVRLGVVTRFTLEGSLAHRKTRNSDPLYALRDLDINEGSIGVKYRPGGALVLGAAVRLTQGDYPRYSKDSLTGAYTSEGFDRKNLDLTADWPLSGASTVVARLSIGQDDYDSVTARDFSGVTGNLTWNWKPTGRLSLNTGFSRSAGDDTQIVIGPDLSYLSNSISRVRNTLSFNAGYEVTAKIQARAGLSYSDGSVVDAAGVDAGSDRATTASLGVSWAPTRSIRTGCDLGRVQRRGPTAASDYGNNTFGCFGEFTLR